MKKYFLDDVKTLCTYGEDYVRYYNKNNEYVMVIFEDGEYNPYTGRKVIKNENSKCRCKSNGIIAKRK